MKHYIINEEATKTTHDMNSTSDYHEAREKRQPEKADSIDSFLKAYTRAVSDWYKKNSVMGLEEKKKK